jgi:DNA helicase-2/ATP-dependent DNA helicase PcrA
MKAVRALNWTTENFRFLKGLEAIEKTGASLPDDERALVLQDLVEWRKHWNYFVRSVPGGRHSVQLFLNHVALGTTQQPSHEGISLLTVHSAKGMEFEIVFVIGMTEGTFPDYRAKGDAMTEEWRNAFVAVTRSRRLLYLTWPKIKKMPWGDYAVQKQSRFITKLKAAT